MKQHRYRVTLEHIADANGNPQQREPLVFEVANHDEIFSILERVQGRLGLDEHSTTAMIVGQKLFAEVMLEHRNEPLFAEFWPHFVAYMKQLKASLKTASNS